jgi:hypothetical protein
MRQARLRTQCGKQHETCQGCKQNVSAADERRHCPDIAIRLAMSAEIMGFVLAGDPKAAVTGG